MVKATIKSKGKSMELEGDMLLGTAIRYGAIDNSEVFVVGDVIRSILPEVLAGTAAALLKGYFSGEELEKAYADFHTAFHTAAEAAWEEEK
ncbi:hypothetical protein [Clostridium sp.]